MDDELIPNTDNIRTILRKHDIDKDLKFLQIEYLLDNGLTDVNDNNNLMKTTPLMTASIMAGIGSDSDPLWPICELLIHNGADLNLQNKRGDTALMLAVKHSSHSSHLRIIQLLIDYGADPFIINNRGEQAIDLVRNPVDSNILKEYMYNIKLDRAKQQLSMALVNEQLGLDYDASSVLGSNIDKQPYMLRNTRVNPYTDWLQDFGQYGSGKRSGKKKKKRKKTKKKRN